MNTTGKAPDQSLGSQLYVDVRDNNDSKYLKIGKRPARFFLRSREEELSPNAVIKIEKEEAKRATKQPTYKERDLHPLLAYFAYANPPFNRGRSIFTKTIFHEGSRRRGYNNKICDQNPDFRKFFGAVKIDFDSKRVHRFEYDEFTKDPAKLISKMLDSK